MADHQTNTPHRLSANLLLLGFVIVLFFVNFYNESLFFRPRSYHQWRQSDCLSITKNYYEEGMHFFSPKIHYQGTKDGRAVSEMPILNYTTACFWKIFGEHEFIYRLLEYLIYLTAIFVFFNTLLKISQSTILSFFLCSLLLTSPLLTYYSLNFIADVPALSFAIISFCLLWQHIQEPSKKKFFTALVTGGLAVLLKASALTPFLILVLVAMAGISRLHLKFNLPNLQLKKSLIVLSVLSVILIIVAWYRYALYYNSNNNNNVFLLTILPIWEMTEKDLIYNIKTLFNELFPIFLSKPMFLLFLLLYLYVWANLSKLQGFLKLSFVLSSLYFMGYLLAFFQVFSVHDYYLTNLMILPVITFICIAMLLRETLLERTFKKLVLLIVVVLVPLNAMHSAAVYRLRNIKDDKLAYWYPTISEQERDLARYLFWDYGNGIQKLEQFTPVLRAHGIQRTDKVLVIPDGSFNIALYMMDQKGYPIARHHFKENPDILKPFLNKGLQYAIVADTVLLTEPAFLNYASHFEPFFVSGSVKVFKWK